jgi:hypothetical protein
MTNLIANIINTLKADGTIHGYVADRIYPRGVDIFPETTLFPLITIYTVSEVTRSNPRGERETLIQIDIWSRKNQLEIESIAERALAVLNFQQFHTGVGTTILRWQREDAGVDAFESDRRIWHRAITYRAWAKP